MGPGAFVMTRRSKRSRAKRPFTSPPQWAIARRRGARRSRSGPRRGLSQVVTRASAAARGARLATTRIGVKEKRSAMIPIRNVEPIVPRPAAVPDRPETVATARLWKRSAGKESAMVDMAAYEKVAIAKQATRAGKEERKAAGIRARTPKPPPTTSALRARPTEKPRRIRALDTPPPKKLPRSEARNGTQKPAAVSSSLKPFATR